MMLIIWTGRPEYLKHAIRQAAFFRLNFFAIKLEGHFQCKSAPVLVEPYALSPADLRELTDYGRRYHAAYSLPRWPGPHRVYIEASEYARLRE